MLIHLNSMFPVFITLVNFIALCTGPFFYLTTITCHFLKILHHVWVVGWVAMLIQSTCGQEVRSSFLSDMALHHCMIHAWHFKTVWWSHLQGSSIQWIMLEQVDTGIYNVSVNGDWLVGKVKLANLGQGLATNNWQNDPIYKTFQNKFSTLQGNVP